MYFLERGYNQGMPITWAPSGVDADIPTAPIAISWDMATTNFAGQIQPDFSHSFAQPYQPLPPDTVSGTEVSLALQAWSAVANIEFQYNNEGDSPETDLRFGFANLPSGIAGRTTYTNTPYTDHFATDVMIRIADPSTHPITRMSGENGFLAYDATSKNPVTVVQDLMHEIGHALGLADNPSDPQSIMNPALGPGNLTLDQNDIDGIQALYGAPGMPHPYA